MLPPAAAQTLPRLNVRQARMVSLLVLRPTWIERGSTVNLRLETTPGHPPATARQRRNAWSGVTRRLDTARYPLLRQGCRRGSRASPPDREPRTAPSPTRVVLGRARAAYAARVR